MICNSVCAIVMMYEDKITNFGISTYIISLGASFVNFILDLRTLKSMRTLSYAVTKILKDN